MNKLGGERKQQRKAKGIKICSWEFGDRAARAGGMTGDWENVEQNRNREVHIAGKTLKNEEAFSLVWGGGQVSRDDVRKKGRLNKTIGPESGTSLIGLS